MDDEILNDEDVISCATGVTVKEGDTVTVMLVDGVPTVISSSSSQQTAAEASETAQRVEAHFWHDTEGAHVTEAEGSVEGNNILIDTDSVDIRNSADVLASFDKEATTFNPNAEPGENIAQFGRTGLKLYRSGQYGSVLIDPSKVEVGEDYSGTRVQAGSIALNNSAGVDWSDPDVKLNDPEIYARYNPFDKVEQLYVNADQMDVFSLRNCKAIPSNSNLNDYMTPGNYFVSSGNVWSTLSGTVAGWPNGSAKYVFVKQITDTIVTQTVVDSANGRTFVRRNSAGTWQPWYCSAGSVAIVEAGTTSDGWTYRKYSDGSCVADYYETGTYSFSNSTIVSGLKAYTLTNMKLPFNMRRVTAQGGTAGSFPSFVAIRGTGAGGNTLSDTITVVWYALTTSTSTTAIRISVSGYWS